MAVSKFQPLSAIETAYRAGIRLFGESRVQEAAEKFADFRGQHQDIDLHLIGNLQRNKVKASVTLFDCLQSIDRESLIVELIKACTDRIDPLPVLLELHTGEESKRGFPDADALCRAAELILSHPGLLLRGLMTIAPFTEDESRIRLSFRMLVSAQHKLRVHFPGCDWSCLSMGMSNDFEIALEEGATLVRVGTALFGER
jgi:pyridoxal phosphate enzyme (YggS family)